MVVGIMSTGIARGAEVMEAVLLASIILYFNNQHDVTNLNQSTALSLLAAEHGPDPPQLVFPVFVYHHFLSMLQIITQYYKIPPPPSNSS